METETPPPPTTELPTEAETPPTDPPPPPAEVQAEPATTVNIGPPIAAGSVTITKPETNNKFGVNTRDGLIIVGNLPPLAGGLLPRDALNLAAWLSIVVDRNTPDDGQDANADLFNAIVEANPAA